MKADTESGASRLTRWDSRLRVLHAPPSAGPHGGGSWERSLILPVAGWTCKAPCVHLGNEKAWVFFFFLNFLFCIGVRAKSLQSCRTLCDPLDCNPPGFSVHGIFQPRILEWVPMPSSEGSSQPRGSNPCLYVSCIGRQVLYH